MKKKNILFVILSVMAVTGLAGCGKPNVEKVTNKMMEQKYNSVTLRVESKAQSVADIDGEEYDLTYDVFYNIAVDGMLTDNGKISINGSDKYNIMGIFAGDNELQAYYDSETDRYYELEDFSQEWEYKDVADITWNAEAMDYIKNAFINMWFRAEAEKDTYDMNGTTCYVLDLNVGADEILNYLEACSEKLGREQQFSEFKNELFGIIKAEDPDRVLAAIRLNMKAYVSKKENYLLAVDIDYGNTDVLNVLSQLNLPEQFSAIKINKFDIKNNITRITIGNFDISEVSIPEEVYNSEYVMSEYNDFGIEDFDMSNAVISDGSVIANDDEQETEDDSEADYTEYFSDIRQTELFDSDNNKITDIKVPDGYYYCSDFSSEQKINMMSEDSTVDVYISSDITDGYVTGNMALYLTEGAFEEIFEKKDEFIDNSLAAYYEEKMGPTTNHYVVVHYDNGSDVIISFGKSDYVGWTEADFVNFAKEVLE